MDFNSSSWSILRNSHSQIDMFFKIVVKIFKNFTGKHLCWSLPLINFITKVFSSDFFCTGFLQRFFLHSFFLVKFAKFLRTSFYRTPPVAASVFCKDFVDISYENSHIRTRRLYVSAAYLFPKCNFILVCRMSFSDWWDTCIS